MTTAESASGALAIMEKNSNLNIVIADFSMPGMAIYEFVRKVHHQSMTIPVILIAEDVTMELAWEAMGNGVCFLFSKSPSDRDIIDTWQHVCRVTGELPALTDITSSIAGEEYGNPDSGNSCGGAAINRNLRNMERKIMNSDEENNTDEDVGCNPKKPRMTWTAAPHAKFFQAINILGEHRAHRNSILGMMKEPGLTNIQVSSHLQEFRESQRLHLNPQETALPVMPVVLPTVPLGKFKKEQTSDTANANYMATQGAFQIPRPMIRRNAPRFVGYTIEYVKQKLDALYYSGNNTRKAISNNGSVQVGEGNGGVQIAQCIDPKRKSNANGNTSAHMTNGFPAPNMEPTGVQVAEGDGGKRDERTDTNYYCTENAYVREQAPLVRQIFSTGIQASAQLTNGFKDLNQEPTGDFKTGTLCFGNAGNLANVSHANFGEGNSGANQPYFSEMSGLDDINKVIQLESSEVDLSDLIY